MVVTAKATWIGLIVLFLVIILVIASALYWQHTTGTSPVHALLSFTTLAQVAQGC